MINFGISMSGSGDTCSPGLDFQTPWGVEIPSQCGVVTSFYLLWHLFEQRETIAWKHVSHHFPQVTSCWLTCCWTSSSAQLLPVLSSWHPWPTPGPGFDWMTSTVTGVMIPWRPMDRASWLTSSLHAHLPRGYKVRWDEVSFGFEFGWFR